MRPDTYPVIHVANIMDTLSNADVFLDEVQRVIIQCDRSCSVCYNFIIQLGQHIRQTHSNDSSLSNESIVPVPRTDEFILCDVFDQTHSTTVVDLQNQPSTSTHTHTVEGDPLENPTPDTTKLFELVEVKVEVDPDQFYMDGVERVDDQYVQFKNEIDNHGVNPEYDYHQGQVCSEMEVETVSREENELDSESESPIIQTVLLSATKKSRMLKRLQTNIFRSKCKECIFGFITPSDMETHLMNTHEQYENSQELFYDRYTTDKSSDEIFCTNCHKYFPSEEISRLHSQSVRCRKVFSCETCGKFFIRKPSLQQHMRHHTGERPFKCVRCDETFVTESTLKYHTRQHERSICKFCYKKFNGSAELNQHYFNVHLKEGKDVDSISKEYVNTDTESE